LARHVLGAVLGLSDGILTALTLASGRLLRGGHPITLTLAVRIALAACASSAFVYFVARYADLRGELVRAELELNLSSRGRLATTRLGRAVRDEALTGSALACACSFIGALVPLAAGALIRHPPWLGMALTIGSLGLLGVALARALSGSRVRWAAALMLGGVAISWLGSVLHLV